MGEAKRKRLAQQRASESFNRPAFAKVIRHLIHEAYGDGKCLVTALTAERALCALGVQAAWCAGYVMWRISPEAHGTLGYHPSVAIGPPGAGFHAWNVVAGAIVDFGTWTIRHGAAEMDALDGYRTTVEWCPDFLWTSEPPLPWNVVMNGFKPGMFCYERVPEVEDRLRLDKGAFAAADELAPMVAQLYRRVRDYPDFNLDVTVRHGTEQPELAIEQHRPMRMIDAPHDEAGIRAMLKQAKAQGVREITLVYPDEKTGALVPFETLRLEA